MHVCSVIETRQSETTMPKDNSSYFPKRKRRAASGGTRTRDVLHVHVYISDMCVHVEDCTWRSSDASTCISQTEASTAEDPPNKNLLYCMSEILVMVACRISSDTGRYFSTGYYDDGDLIRWARLYFHQLLTCTLD